MTAFAPPYLAVGVHGESARYGTCRHPRFGLCSLGANPGGESVDDDVPADLLPFFASRTREERLAWWRAVRKAYAGAANQLADIEWPVATTTTVPPTPPTTRVLSA